MPDDTVEVPRESWATPEYIATLNGISALSHRELVAKFSPMSPNGEPTTEDWECALRCAAYTAESRGNSYFHLNQEYGQLVARVRAQEKLIAELELDKKRLDVLEELWKAYRIDVVEDEAGVVWLMILSDPNDKLALPYGDEYGTFRAAADAGLTTRTPARKDA
jgi:hypothetical protein